MWIFSKEKLKRPFHCLLCATWIICGKSLGEFCLEVQARGNLFSHPNCGIFSTGSCLLDWSHFPQPSAFPSVIQLCKQRGSRHFRALPSPVPPARPCLHPAHRTPALRVPEKRASHYCLDRETSTGINFKKLPATTWQPPFTNDPTAATRRGSLRVRVPVREVWSQCYTAVRGSGIVSGMLWPLWSLAQPDVPAPARTGTASGTRDPAVKFC